MNTEGSINAERESIVIPDETPKEEDSSKLDQVKTKLKDCTSGCSIRRLLHIICTFALLGLAYQIYDTEDKFIYKYNSAVVENLSQGLIMLEDLLIIDAKQTCSSREGYEAILFGKWKGNIEGCFKNGVFFEKNCEGEHFYPMSPEIPIYIYRGKKFCKKKGNKDYDAIYKNIYEKECPENKIDCGEIDTLAQHYCVDDKDECPINFFEFSENVPIEIQDKSYKSFNFPTLDKPTFKLYYSNDMGSEGKIISQFAISDDIPCSELGVYPSDSKKNFVLENYVSRCIKEDIRFEEQTKVDTYSKEALYKENKINLNYYPFKEDLEVKLFYTRYFGYNKKYDKDKQIFTQKQFEEYKKNTHKAIENAKFIIIAFAVSLLFCGGVMLTNKGDLIQSMFAKNNVFWDSSLFIISIVSIVFVTIGFIRIFNARYSLDGYDIITEEWLTKERERIDEVFIYYLIMLIAVWTVDIFHLVASIYRFCEAKKEAENNNRLKGITLGDNGNQDHLDTSGFGEEGLLS